MLKIFQIFVPKKWTIKYQVHRVIHWKMNEDSKNTTEEITTFFLEEDQFNNRRYTIHSCGWTKTFKSYDQFIPEMELWKKTGILPRGSQNILQQKLKS